ncbi:hypothetical protein K432DRAFT_381245 [Lepidopterella palustris CBS 459.81]|uniref:Luciferase domain-containing protein n=1 Tax=Lepidopterella palustris CBS 459.81 TaxID=1314670 RepID=A0A8E2JGJ8_9PEZI|nr:hypothetical protein K432DRAFT_381245 [Lepidopterella palustris CBS 459.81]
MSLVNPKLTESFKKLEEIAREHRLLIALGGSVALTLWIVRDFLRWRSFGTGGTPPTVRGYLRIRKFWFFRFFKRDDLRDASPLSTEGPTYLDKPIPRREGGRPKLTHWIMPQRQMPDSITPKAHERLLQLMSFFATNHSTILSHAPSKTEGGTGPAIYADPSLPTLNPASAKIGYEMAHVHPAENSLHVYLSPRDAREVVEKEWGERFPLGAIAPASWVMVYAPRNEDEVDLVERIVRAAVGWNTGVRI